jgi:hypothetical protein
MWFPEPASPDPTYCRRLEETEDWLARSTLPLAVDCRRFLNEHLECFEAADQEVLTRGLRTHWTSTFFEMVVGRVLQLLGGSVSLERANAHGRRPDFHAEFFGDGVTVEATVPVINGSVHDLTKQRAPLLDLIEDHVPPGWGIVVVELPSIGAGDSKKGFKRAVVEMLAVDPPAEGDSSLLLQRETDQGPVTLRLIPWQADGDTGLLTHGGSGFVDETPSRIRRALDRKRRQVRGTNEPVIVAIRASGLVSSFAHFDRAVFGSDYSALGFNGEVLGTGFRADGVFARAASTPPTYAAALAFLAVDFPVCVQPVLYLHPRFTGELPQALLALERRYLTPDGRGIRVTPALRDDLLSGLHLVGRDW